MKQLLLLSLSALVLLSSCTGNKKNDLAINGQQEFSDSAVSTLRIFKNAAGQRTIQKNNTYYDLIDFTDRADAKKMLLKVTKSETTILDSNTSESTFRVSVSDIAGGKSSWAKDIPGTDIDYTNKVLVAHKEASKENEEDTYTQYGLISGEKLMTYTYSSLTALIPNTSNKRFLGYLSKLSCTPDKPKGFATLSYVGSNEVLDKINISVKGDKKIADYTPELTLLTSQETSNTVANEGKTVILAQADRNFQPKDIGGFGIKISYAVQDVKDPVVIFIPIREDHIDLENAMYDKSIFNLAKED
jgi:hypothetical protein